MADVREGVIEKMHTKSGTGKRGAWTKYSAVINGEWVNFGFDNPGYSEGQTVKVLVEQDQYGLQVKQHRLSDVQQEAANNPSSGGNGGSGGGAAWGNASNVASVLITTMKDLDALPITAATGKANKAKRYDEIMDIFNKIRVQLYNDSLDPERVISQYPDAGEVETNEPTPLPDAAEESDEDDFEDDIPF